MTDEHLIEASQRQADQQLEMAIEAAKKQAQRGTLKAKGACHDCGDAFGKDDPHYEARLFCDGLCEESWRRWYQSQVRKYGPNYAPRSAA